MGLNLKEADLITLLTATNDKLDSIITLLGAMPVATTPPVHDLDDIYTLLATSNTNTGDTYTKLTALDSNVNSLYVYLVDELGLLLTAIGDIRNNLFYGLVNLGLTVNDDESVISGWLADVQNLLALMQGALGVPIDANNRNVIELLAEIDDRPLGNPNGGLVPQSVCDDAYISNQMVLVPTIASLWPPTIWAVFPDPPVTGITFGTTFGFGTDQTELIADDDDWSVWNIYVASEASTFGVYFGPDVDLAVARYPTNVWLSLSFLTTHLAVFVSGESSVRVYLCTGTPGEGSSSGGPWGGGSGSGGTWPGGETTWTECIDVPSIPVTQTDPSSATHSVHDANLFLIPGMDMHVTMVYSGGTISFTEDIVANFDFNGCSFELVSGTSARVVWTNAEGGAISSHNLTSGDAPFVMTTTTFALLVDDAASGSPSGAFTVRVCPPA